MKHLAYPLLLCLLLPTAQGQDGKKKADPTPDPIIIPQPPVPPTPPPKPPVPGAPVVLSSDQTYVVRANTPVRVLSSDETILAVTEDVGPIKIRGVFYPDTTRSTKTFTDKQVFSVDPLGEGQVTLLVVPADSSIPVMRIKILVGPQPPPPPPPNPVTISISPTTATVPTKGTQQFAATVSQGGIRWTCSGAGTVDQTGLFTAAANAGTAVIVVVSTLDPSKTVSATITVTDLPPPPPDPLTKSLQAAYTAETDANKVAHLRNFTAILPVLIPAIKAGGQVTTLAQLQQKMDAMSKNVTDNSFVSVRKVASEYVASKMPKQDAKITDADWTNADAACNDIAKALQNVKGGR